MDTSNLPNGVHAQGRNQEAPRPLKALRNQRPIESEGLGLLARLTDLIDGPKAAMSLYRMYSTSGGKDAFLLQRLAVLQASREAYDEKLQTPSRPG